MNTTIDRPLTVEEMSALPEFGFGFEKHAYSPEDKARGFIMIRGKRVNVVVGCNSIMIPVVPETMASYIGPDDPMGYTDSDGNAWSIGQYSDGRWFRRKR